MTLLAVAVMCLASCSFNKEIPDDALIEVEYAPVDEPEQKRPPTITANDETFEITLESKKGYVVSVVDDGFVVTLSGKQILSGFMGSTHDEATTLADLKRGDYYVTAVSDGWFFESTDTNIAGYLREISDKTTIRMNGNMADRVISADINYNIKFTPVTLSPAVEETTAADSDTTSATLTTASGVKASVETLDLYQLSGTGDTLNITKEGKPIADITLSDSPTWAETVESIKALYGGTETDDGTYTYAYSENSVNYKGMIKKLSDSVYYTLVQKEGAEDSTFEALSNGLKVELA